MVDDLVRVIAVTLEVAVLFGVFYCLLNGVRLIVMEYVVGVEYSNMVKIGFGVIEFLILVFLVAHVTSFYPWVID